MSNIGSRRLPLVGAGRLGVLSIHLDGAPCRVGCEFCYLGARTDGAGGPRAPLLDAALVEEALGRLDYAEVAVALSEPAAQFLPSLRAIVRAASARRRPVAVTTTAAVVAGLYRDRDGEDPLAGVSRVSISVDPRKGPTAAPCVGNVARLGRGRLGDREVALIVSLVSPRFADDLLDGGLASLVALPEVDRVALHALKPPPNWCNAAFWLRSLARLAPLLERHLDRRLYLDCYVAARILGLGGCPARPDLSPGAPGGVAFRACVYQSAPDFLADGADDLAARLEGFTAPARCPFPIA